MFIQNLAELNDSYKFQHYRIYRTLKKREIKLYSFIDKYLESYCLYYNLSTNYICEVHERFVRKYQQDLKNFSITKKYPFELDNDSFLLSRIDYDLILILSFLLEKHRFKIASWLNEFVVEDDILCIGIGPGVELGILIEHQNINLKNFVGYDLQISDFVRSKFGDNIMEEEFQPNNRKYKTVLLIEILEHLYDPEQMIRLVADCLSSTGSLFITTAINIPQFDHFYNFIPREIRKILERSGLVASSVEVIDHHYLVSNVCSSNELVMAEKARI